MMMENLVQDFVDENEEMELVTISALEYDLLMMAATILSRLEDAGIEELEIYQNVIKQLDQEV